MKIGPSTDACIDTRRIVEENENGMRELEASVNELSDRILAYQNDRYQFELDMASLDHKYKQISHDIKTSFIVRVKDMIHEISVGTSGYASPYFSRVFSVAKRTYENIRVTPRMIGVNLLALSVSVLSIFVFLNIKDGSNKNKSS